MATVLQFFVIAVTTVCMLGVLLAVVFVLGRDVREPVRVLETPGVAKRRLALVPLVGIAGLVGLWILLFISTTRVL